MSDLSINLAGIKSPNPFWVASGPPSNTAYQCHRAFEAGLRVCRIFRIDSLQRTLKLALAELQRQHLHAVRPDDWLPYAAGHRKA